MRTAKEAARAWDAASKAHAKNYAAMLDPVERVRTEYVAGRITVEELETLLDRAYGLVSA